MLLPVQLDLEFIALIAALGQEQLWYAAAGGLAVADVVKPRELDR